MLSSIRFKKNLLKTIFIALFLYTSALQSEIIVSEIHYHPLQGAEDIDKNLYEFIELKNTGNTSREMGQYQFVDGITYSFPSDFQLEPGAFVILAADSNRFEERYGFAPFGLYSGKLNNSGERVVLVDESRNRVILEFTYDTKVPWPVSADGAGFSLVAADTNGTGSPATPEYWRASHSIHGSPGADDTEASDIPEVFINEVLTNTDEPILDAIEIYNPGTIAIDLSGWYLTDDKQKPKKFLIPDGTVIEPDGYLVFDESDFNAIDALEPFALNSHGDGAYIFSADGGELTGFGHGFNYGEIDTGITFGRYLTSTGEEHCVPMARPTLGLPNSEPKIGPLVITEINYNPSTSIPYVEIQNISAQDIDLFDPLRPDNTWKVRGLSFSFPSGVSISAGESVVLAADQTDVQTFKAINGLDENTQVYSFSGTLQSDGETLTIGKPCEPYLDDAGVDLIVPYMDIDKVSFSNTSPWPDCEVGSTLHRKSTGLYGNDPANWSALGASPGTSVLRPKAFKSRNRFRILQNGKSKIRLSFDLPSEESLQIDMTDLRGVRVKSIHKNLSAGAHRLDIDTRDMATGVYIIRMSADGLIRKGVAVLRR
ncbi:MAG: lamin tail domain-containing protein [Chitinispirillaceae bacterium]